MSATALEPAAKRKRVELEDATETVESSVSPPVRSTIWFEDGNVVLQCQGTQYKVHRGILSANSPIFKDMFSTAHASLEDGEVEGCPVVHMPDLGKDVEYVLQAIFQPRCVNHPCFLILILKPCVRCVVPFESLPIDALVAYLKMGRKYDIDAVRSRAQSQLFHLYPVELEDFDSIQAHSTIRDQLASSEPDVDFAIANLAREHGLLSVLPVALYWCCHRWSEELLSSGKQRRDKTSPYTLSEDNEHACLAALHRLAKLQSNTTFAWMDTEHMYPPSVRCLNEDECGTTCALKAARIFLPFPRIDGLGKWDEDWEMDLCDPCKQDAKTLHDSERYAFWRRLPQAFDLPGWNELKTERTATRS